MGSQPSTGGPQATDVETFAVESLLDATSSVAFARFTQDGVLLHANPRFLRICGRSEGPIRVTELVTEGQRDDLARQLAAGDVPTGGRHLHFAAGTRPPISLLVSWARDGEDLVMVGEPPVEDGEPLQSALVKLNHRVSDLARENAKKSAQLSKALEDVRQTQTMLVHREKMAALGQVTAGVAHELNNPLAYVKNNVYLLGRDLDALLGLINLFGENLDAIEKAQPTLFETIMNRVEAIDLPGLGSRMPELVESIEQGVDRATGLVDRLRTFSRLDEAKVKPIDLNESLRSVVDFVGFLLRAKDTGLTVDYGELPTVTCAPGDVNQAVLNILTNAIQAAPPGGQVGLRTHVQDDEVLIHISDDGPGVPADLAERIFEPFFTTRPVGEGTGLGLPIAHTIVAEHGGSITLERSSAQGALFTIHLPVDQVATP